MGLILIRANVSILSFEGFLTKTGDRNALISYPSEWYKYKAFPFKPGDQINILIEDGYIRKAYQAKKKSVILLSPLLKQPLEYTGCFCNVTPDIVPGSLELSVFWIATRYFYRSYHIS